MTHKKKLLLTVDCYILTATIRGAYKLSGHHFLYFFYLFKDLAHHILIFYFLFLFLLDNGGRCFLDEAFIAEFAVDPG